MRAHKCEGSPLLAATYGRKQVPSGRTSLLAKVPPVPRTFAAAGRRVGPQKSMCGDVHFALWASFVCAHTMADPGPAEVSGVDPPQEPPPPPPIVSSAVVWTTLASLGFVNFGLLFAFLLGPYLLYYVPVLFVLLLVLSIIGALMAHFAVWGTLRATNTFSAVTGALLGASVLLNTYVYYKIYTVGASWRKRGRAGWFGARGGGGGERAAAATPAAVVMSAPPTTTLRVAPRKKRRAN